jgi:hypothetical protein
VPYVGVGIAASLQTIVDHLQPTNSSPIQDLPNDAE